MLIKLTDAFYESLHCITHIDEVGPHRYQESKRQLNDKLETLIDFIMKKRK